mmetsp:Transcript_22304/g.35540  ORF Transcript_22304/g.35540 Transcript_22304/m.35540 type:complete len:100 (-) Transcript_22304:500-799(-)
MRAVGDLVGKVRSKNAGPFWLTIDIFCGGADAYAQVVSGLSTPAVAQVLNAEEDNVKRFDIADLQVVKFSLPRPAIQGAQDDRDMHGASFAALIAEMPI